MEITVHVKEPTPEFERDLLTLLDKHRATLRTNTGWSVDRARRFCDELVQPRARRILWQIIAKDDGEVSADDLRDNDDSSLRGHAGAFTRIVKRGAAEGWWDTGLKSPVIALGPGSGKVQGYRIRDKETLEAFRTVLGPPRIDELRQVLRDNRPETPDLDTPIREALERQTTVLRRSQETDHDTAADRTNEK